MNGVHYQVMMSVGYRVSPSHYNIPTLNFRSSLISQFKGHSSSDTTHQDEFLSKLWTLFYYWFFLFWNSIKNCADFKGFFFAQRDVNDLWIKIINSKITQNNARDWTIQHLEPPSFCFFWICFFINELIWITVLTQLL